MSIGKRDACHAIGTFALIERGIVGFTTQPQPPLQDGDLLACRIDAKLIRFSRFLFFRFCFGLFAVLLFRHAFAAQCTA